MTAKETLAHQLRVQFELPPHRPTSEELDAILEDATAFITRNGRSPSKDEWRAITLQRVSFDGSYFYKGLNFQDLNALLAMIRAQAASAKKQGGG